MVLNYIDKATVLFFAGAGFVSIFVSNSLIGISGHITSASVRLKRAAGIKKLSQWSNKKKKSSIE